MVKLNFCQIVILVCLVLNVPIHVQYGWNKSNPLWVVIAIAGLVIGIRVFFKLLEGKDASDE